LKGCPREEVHRQLSRVRLAAVANRKVRQLSKGMLQRLGLAVALLGQPELLVLDEPFNGLDPVVLDEFTAIIRQEQARGATAIISTHTISAIQSLASHVAILLGGKLALHASLAELRREGGSDSCLASLYQSVARRASRQAREVMVA
jgi:ABC-2 type transport system ATP-binding protein